MDYQKPNGYVNPLTANADTCLQKLMQWQQKGSNIVWTRLGFGHNVALFMIRSVVSTMTSQNESIQNVMLNYIEQGTCNTYKNTLEKFRLPCNKLE